MRRFQQLLAVAVAALVTAAMTILPATAAAAAPPIDPSFPGSWAKWTFHSGGNYNLDLEIGGAKGDGTAAQLYGENGGSNQVWFQETAAEGGQFLHPGYNRWLCLGRTGNASGTPVVVQNCSGSVNQRWAIPRYAQQFYFIKPWDNSGVCIDVPGSNFTQGIDLQLWSCNNSSAQYWSTGLCYAGGCDNQWPDVNSCDTGGADEVRDVSQGGNRIVLVYSAGCQAFYTRLSHSSGSIYSVDMILYRYHTDGHTDAMRLVVNPGQTRWSAMYGVDQDGATFEACYENPLNPGDPRFCSGLWWA